MQKNLKKFRRIDPPQIFMRCRTLFSISLLFFYVVIQACYSSTAVKGVPVKDLVIREDQKILRRIISKKEKDVIASMSISHGNNTFAEVSGIPEYRIGPLDVLALNSHIGDKVTTTTVTVSNRGSISYSFIDDLNVNGITPSQLDEVLTGKLSNFIKSPRIDVLVKEFKSKNVTVLGELASLRRTSGTGTSASGRIYLNGKTSLMDLIAMAGGYTVDADIKKVKLLRGGRAYLINIYDILEKGDNSKNVIIDHGDVVDVPELPALGERIFVMGEVRAQGVYALKDVRDLLGAIALAGNVTPLAKEENTLIVRGYTEQNDGPLVMMSDVKALLRKADLNQNIPLKDGDLVYVPRMLIGDINDWITNTKPLLDFLFYPKQFQDSYSTRDYLHINPR
ncbi:polysaccharide biosynthesis/export family protein [Thermodesulfobacteriota bacterium]